MHWAVFKGQRLPKTKTKEERRRVLFDVAVAVGCWLLAGVAIGWVLGLGSGVAGRS
jgi:hypothetical protein